VLACGRSLIGSEDAQVQTAAEEEHFVHCIVNINFLNRRLLRIAFNSKLGSPPHQLLDEGRADYLGTSDESIHILGCKPNVGRVASPAFQRDQKNATFTNLSVPRALSPFPLDPIQ